MKLSTKTVNAILERLSNDCKYQTWETASEYGEPGYSFDGDDSTNIVVLGYYWCECDNETAINRRTLPGRPRLTHGMHSLEDHHPTLWAQLEAQGVQFEWSDEWTIPTDSDKAYRVNSDSHWWKPSIVWDADNGEWLTPDDDLDTWLDWAVKDPSRCLTQHTAEQLIEAGFHQHGGTYQSGLHEGMDDDPAKIAEKLRAVLGVPVLGLNNIDIVFLLTESSQFYIEFTAWWRDQENND